MLAREPNLPEAWLGRGNVLMKLKRREEAAAAFDRALELKADLAEAWLGRGNVLFDLERYQDAAAAYGKALAVRPDLHNAASLRVLSKLYICDWTYLEDEIARLLKASRENPRSGGDFPLTAIPSSPADQIRLAKCYVRDRPAFSPMWRGDVYSTIAFALPICPPISTSIRTAIWRLACLSGTTDQV